MAQSSETVVTGGTEVPDDIDVHTTAGKLADLKRRVAAVAHAGSERAVEKQHARGKKTARERLELLLDEGSFGEMDKYARHRSVAFGQEQNRPYGEGPPWFQDSRPVSLGCRIAGLADPEMLVEVDAMAIIGAHEDIEWLSLAE